MSDYFVKCDTYNVVVIGDSKVGKSTFIELLCNSQLSNNYTVYRQTVLPELKTLYIFDKVLGRHICLNILDTPGFNENSDTGVNRSNKEVQQIISNFAKNDITFVNMILFTFNGQAGFTIKQQELLLETFAFFTNKFIPSFALLGTHFENITKEEEKIWKNDFIKNPTIRSIIKKINGRLFFTGAQIGNCESTIETKFIERQKERIAFFLKVLCKMPRILFKSFDLNKPTPLDVYESAGHSNYVISEYPNENTKIKRKIDETLVKFSQQISLLSNDIDIDKYSTMYKHFDADIKKVELIYPKEEDLEMITQYNASERQLKILSKHIYDQHKRLTLFCTEIVKRYNLLLLEDTKNSEIPQEPEFIDIFKKLDEESSDVEFDDLLNI